MQWTWPMVIWAAAALLLFAAEAVAPGAFMLWLGLAAAAVFVLVWVFDLPVLAQVAAFVALSFASIQVYRKWFRGPGRERQSDRPGLNRRAEHHIGRTLPLERDIVGGEGRVKIGDAFWTVTGPDLPAGTMVKVVATDGMTLRVEAV
ncbi:NfeD family protein [Marilutibacter alkalisoli]|uniref:NfeD family protein n=1 Tax=Marilutibacter alkalisoli TaxID=2591633 RepID=A0A514BQI0_9GAMM|nr:NfeD family protein [Lysobacter alkalisoli]QDH69279.1 NfeD family protein [Lysobacter alkalisoli]